MFKKLERKAIKIRKLIAEFRLAEERQAQYDALVGEAVSYPIIRDLINSAAYGVVIRLIFKDGTTMEIRREDPRGPTPDKVDASF